MVASGPSRTRSASSTNSAGTSGPPTASFTAIQAIGKPEAIERTKGKQVSEVISEVARAIQGGGQLGYDAALVDPERQGQLHACLAGAHSKAVFVRDRLCGIACPPGDGLGVAHPRTRAIASGP